MINSKYLVKASILGASVIGLDALSKWWVHHFIPLMNWNLFYPFGGIGVFKDFFGTQFAIVHETNKGAAWGSFSDYQDILLWLRICMIIGLFFYLLFNQKEKNTMPIALIISGAIGNVIDYFFYGHVVDMIYLKFGSYSYPIFNLADSAIFIGVVWMAFLTLFGKQKNATKRKHSCN